MPEPDRVTALGRAARERLAEPDMWAQGAAVGEGGRDCAITALLWARARVGASNNELYLAKARLARVIGTNFISVWNDEFSRTEAEVLAAFDAAFGKEEDDA